MKKLCLLGSTGSIGTQTLDIVRANRDDLEVVAVAAGSNVDAIEKQIREFSPKLAVLYDEKAAADLKCKIADTNTKVLSGMDGLIEAATMDEADTVLTAMVGMIGIRPTIAAINARKDIALANKETLVCAGDIVMKRAAEKEAEIIPVDSEHAAIFQCLQGRGKNELKKILLTGSGGPFRGRQRSTLENITPEQAVKHPNWNMGAKISVDSATMMNKGLEFIEAMHLFKVTPDDITVLVHPQSIVHSMVELVDGTVIAQLGVPDMVLPIQLALTYPDRIPSIAGSLDFFSLGALTFEAPDLENTPCLGLAMDCARRGGTAPCVMSAANEIAVGLFLKGKTGFNTIYDLSAGAVEHVGAAPADDLDTILEADAAARAYVTERCK